MKNLSEFLTPERKQKLVRLPKEERLHALNLVRNVVRLRERDRWRRDPVYYCENRLRLKLWDKLVEVLESVRDNEQTAVKSANGVGKTTIASAIVPWWLECWDESVALVTGSSWHSIKNALFPYIQERITEGAIFQDTRIEYGSQETGKINQTSIKLSPTHFAIGKAAKLHSGIGGIHSPNLLQVVEEASDLLEIIATAIGGNAVGEHDRRLYLANPIDAGGPFYVWCTDPDVNTITISAMDHPNVRTGRNIIPGAVTRAKVAEKLRAWAREVDRDTPNAVFFPFLKKYYLLDYRAEARILGLFPSTSVDALLSRTLLERCSKRPKVPKGTIALGVDVARFGGDETVFYWVCENGLLYYEAYIGLKETEIAGKIIAWYRSKTPFPLANVAVDCTGGYGGGVVDLLEEAKVPHLDVVFSERSNVPDRFSNLKAEMYWLFKQNVEYQPDYFITDDIVFINQGSNVRHGKDSKGRTRIEGKDEYKKRNGDSPDRLEAAMIGNYALHYTAPSLPPERQAIETSGSKYGESLTRPVGSRYGNSERN